MPVPRRSVERGGEESDSQVDRGRPTRLFSLPDGEPAQFFLHDFDSPNWAERIGEHGGQVTDDEATADVVLTRSRDEYNSLKDRYATSRKTHVRMSGFVDRCINANRFVLAPIPGKGVPGRKPGARRTEFTEEDDERLCQYIAEILPEKGEGGRTGHFIYTDLMRRADQFGQYPWAQRHTKDAWRERYRKKQGRLDQRIAEIVEENPPAPDGKGQYMSRRYGKIVDEEEFMLDAEENAESATDNEDGPIWVKRESAQPQEEEDDEDEDDGDDKQRPAGHQPEAELNPSDQDSDREQEEESPDAQTAERQSKRGPSSRRKATRRISRVSHDIFPASKRRKAVAPRRQEAPSPNSTLVVSDSEDQGQDSSPPVDADVSATFEQPYLPAASPEPEPAEPGPQMRVTRQAASRARLVTRQTRASSRLHTASSPELPPAPMRRRAASRAKAIAATSSPQRLRTRSAVAKAKLSNATPEVVAESESHPTHDEFVARSEDDSDMQEVEVNLINSGFHGGDSPLDSSARSLSDDDLQTSVRVRRAGGAPSGAAGLDEDDQDENDEDEDDSDIEQAAKDAPYSSPPGTRAASMMDKGKGKARETALRRR